MPMIMRVETINYYKGKLHLRAMPEWQQGIAFYDGDLYITGEL